MEKRIELRRYEIVLYVSKGPGVYRLIGGDSDVIYIGRSDTDLQRRLLEHLPGIETNPCIVGKRPTAAYFINTADCWEAYRLECEWYEKYKPPCNDVPPTRPEG